MTERIDEIGYINSEHEHVLLGFREPALLNPSSHPEKWVQVAVTIASAKKLHEELGAFLTNHAKHLH